MSITNNPNSTVHTPPAPAPVPLEYYTPPRPTGPEGLGGWLILPAIGLVLSPILLIVSIVSTAGVLGQLPPSGRIAAVIEMITEAALVAMIIYAAVAFFRKKRNAPTLMICVYAASVGTSLIAVLAFAALITAAVPVAAGQLVRSVIIAAIWIPYFRVSKRVKATFVK